MQMPNAPSIDFFSEENISIARLILKSRIEQCCKELVESDLLDQPLFLTEVAFRWFFLIPLNSLALLSESKLEAYNELRQY